jgi:anaerobic selenocysteine-containing dehydrogenase
LRGLIGTAQRLLSTVLQGFYQSHQATDCGRSGQQHSPGARHARPTGMWCAADEPAHGPEHRECGADGDLPGFRNWANDDHINELAALWNVAPQRIPHDRPPTHAMQIFELGEQGALKLLWISATNPAVSLPQLSRRRALLAHPGLSSWCGTYS